MVTVSGRSVAGALLVGMMLGCSAPTLPADEECLQAALTTWVKLGMHIKDARAQLERRGFGLYPASHKPNDADEEKFIASYSETVGLVCRREWRALLDIKNQRLLEVHGRVFQSCL